MAKLTCWPNLTGAKPVIAVQMSDEDTPFIWIDPDSALKLAQDLIASVVRVNEEHWTKA